MKYSSFVDPVASLQKFKDSLTNKDEVTVCTFAGLSALQRRKKTAKTNAQSEALLAAAQRQLGTPQSSEQFRPDGRPMPPPKDDIYRTTAHAEDENNKRHSVLSDERDFDLDRREGHGHWRRVRRSEHRHSEQPQRDVQREQYSVHPKTAPVLREHYENDHRSKSGVDINRGRRDTVSGIDPKHQASRGTSYDTKHRSKSSIDAGRVRRESVSAPSFREDVDSRAQRTRSESIHRGTDIDGRVARFDNHNRESFDRLDFRLSSNHIAHQLREQPRAGSSDSADSMQVHFHGEGDVAKGPIRITRAQTLRKLNKTISDIEVLLYAYKCNFTDMSQINSSGGPIPTFVARTQDFLTEHFPDLVNHWPFYDGAPDPPRRHGSSKENRDTQFFTKFMSAPARHSDRGSWIYFLKGSLFETQIAEQETRAKAVKRDDRRVAPVAVGANPTYSATGFDEIQDEELVPVKGHPKLAMRLRRNSMVLERPAAPVEINPTTKLTWSRFEMPERRVMSEPCHRTGMECYSILKTSTKPDPATMKCPKQPLAITIPETNGKQSRYHRPTKQNTNMNYESYDLYENNDDHDPYERVRVPRRYGEMPSPSAGPSGNPINGRRYLSVFYTPPGTCTPTGMRIPVPVNMIMPGAGWTAYDLKCALFGDRTFRKEVHVEWFNHMQIVVPKPSDDANGHQRTALILKDDDLLWDMGVRVPSEIVVEFPGYQF